MDRLLKPNSLALHYVYFTLTCMIGSVIVYLTSTQIYSTHYVDALFMSVSAMTGTGLSVLDLSTQSSIQQATLFVLMLLGHAIPVSGIVLLSRRRDLYQITKSSAREKLIEGVSPHALAVESYTQQPAEARCQPVSTKSADLVVCSREVQDITVEMNGDHPKCISHLESESLTQDDLAIVRSLRFGSDPNQRVISFRACPNEQRKWHDKIMQPPIVESRLTALGQDIHKRFQPDIPHHPDEPGVLAARAVQLLSLVVLVYFTLILLLGILTISIWLKRDLPDIALAYNVAPSWAGAFLATSAFSNNGMSLIDANMVPFQREWFPLVALSGLILAGNALYPCFLRMTIWSLRQALPRKREWQTWRRILEFTLSQSQSFYPYLFSAWNTWFLLGANLILYGIMWGAFELSSTEATDTNPLSVRYRALDGLFQALAVRGGGFCIVAFDKLPQGLLALYLLMMYSSAFPVLATISKTEATQKKWEGSLPPEGDHIVAPRAKGIFKWAYCCEIYQHLRSQLGHDLWWISLAVICITVTEEDHYRLQPLNYSTFNIIFEVISAYSCVGVSVGYPGKTYSFCGEWHTFSKLVLAGIALRGRHRGHTLAIDNAQLVCEAQDWVQRHPL